MVGAMSSHCPGLRLSPWSGNKIWSSTTTRRKDTFCDLKTAGSLPLAIVELGDGHGEDWP